MMNDIILQFGWFGILDNVNAFLVVFILIVGILMAFISQKLTIAGFGSFLVFVHIAMETDLFIFDSMLYSIIVILTVVLGFRVVSFVKDGDTQTGV